MSVIISEEPADSADATACMRAYYRELLDRFEMEFDPDDPSLWKVDDMMPPAGRFLVARLDGVPVGCGGLRRFDDRSGEVKRVWVSTDVRGMGVATRLMDMLEALAVEAGHVRLLLDTNGALKEAQAMYARRGYREIARYNDNPYAHHWFEKPLR